MSRKRQTITQTYRIDLYLNALYSVDLFRLDGLLPHFRPRDDTLGNSSFQIFKYLRVYE